MNKKRKKLKSIIVSSAFCLVSAICITSVALSSINWNSNQSQRFYFKDQIFNSYADLSKYIEENCFNSISFVENRDKWSINKNGTTFFFNDPQLLREELSKDIKKYTGTTSLKIINSDELEGISSGDLAKIYFNKPEITTIYRGKNNSIFNSAIEAKKSYLSIHDAYYFNGMYFRNLQELKLYLDSVYYSSKDSEGFNNSLDKSSIAIIDTNGNYSSPINKNALKSNDMSNESINAKKEFVNFINDGVKSYIEISNENTKTYFSKNNFSNILSNFSNYDYTKIYSNQGKGTFVVDLSVDDENTLFGPYFVNATKEIELMTNTDQWKKVTKDDPIISKERDSAQIAGFLGIILPEQVFSDENIEEKNKQISPINIKTLNNELNLYFNEIRNFSPILFENYLNFINLIKSGKNYNSFYSIILSHAWLIDNLIRFGANETIIKKTKVTFNNIAKEIDKNISILIPESLLFSSRDGDKDKKISFEEILDFDSNVKDFNTDIQYYVDEISYYSEFINAINIINLANTNAVSVGGIIPYNFNMLNSFLRKTKTYIENESILSIENSNYYEMLWNTFSSTTPNEFYENTIKNTKNINVADEYIKSITSDISSATSVFNGAYRLLFDESKELLKKKSIIDENNIFYGLSSMMILLIEKNIDSLNFDDFLWLKLMDTLLPTLNMTQKLTEITKSTLQNAVKIAKNIWSEIFDKSQTQNKNNITEKSIYYAFSLLQPSKLLFNSFSLMSTPTIWIVEVLDYVKSGIPNFNTEAIYSNISNIFSNVKNILNDNNMNFDDLIKSSKSFLRFVGKIGGPFLKMIPYVNLAFIAIDILSGAFVPKTNYYSYVYENDDVKYIWNGGQKTTMFWGLKPISETTIKDMKLLKPQRVTSASPNTGFYYNGKIYDNLDKLKKEQLIDIINGTYSLIDDSKMKLVYSFDEIPTDINVTKLSNVFNEIGDINSCTISSNPNNLVSYIYNSVVKDLNNNKENGKYFNQMFVFANGHVASDINQSKEILIDYVVENIKPVKIAQLPVIINGKPDYNGLELEEYTLPFNSWSITEGIKYNSTNNKYIIYDPNISESNQRKLDDTEIITNIEERFFEMFDVDSKQVIKEEIKTANLFTELNNNTREIEVFVVNDGNQTNVKKVFLDKGDAMNYLMTSYDFTVYSKIEEIKKYKLDNNQQIFYSKDELIEWAIKEGEIKYE